jgi:anti-sigma factor ChrR (cupin superfamily)
MENHQKLMLVMKVGMKRHPDEDQLERYSMEVMSTTQAVEIEEHLLICESCQEGLMDMDAYVEAIRRAALVYRREQSSRLLGRTNPAVFRAG